MSKARRIVITHIHERDGYYSVKDQFIGSTGKFRVGPHGSSMDGYFSGDFFSDKGSETTFFFAIRYRRI